jgi:Domain of unknown function (DUF5680)
MDQTAIARLAAFLVEAKRRTYAGLDDDATVATPMVPGSKQLEYSDGELSYRDIYFGMAFFVGQEMVTDKQRAIWSMSYAGGVSPEITDRGEVLEIYAFLRQALLHIGEDRPFRGPSHFEQGSYRYVDKSKAELFEFHGTEQIYRDGIPVYGLRYSGGIIR